MSFDTPSESFCTFFTCRSPKISQQNLSGVWKVSHPCLIENGCKNLRVLLSLQSGAKNCPFLVILRGNVSANIFRRNKATTEEWKTEWTDIANYEGSATLSHKGWSSHRNCSYIAIYPVLFVFGYNAAESGKQGYSYRKLTVVVSCFAGDGHILAMKTVMTAPAIVPTLGKWRLVTDALHIIQPDMTGARSVVVHQRYTNVPSTVRSASTQYWKISMFSACAWWNVISHNIKETPFVCYSHFI